MKMKCTNKDCSQYAEEHQRFSVALVVDEDGEVIEVVETIEAEDFTCCFCHSNSMKRFDLKS